MRQIMRSPYPVFLEGLVRCCSQALPEAELKREGKKRNVWVIQIKMVHPSGGIKEQMSLQLTQQMFCLRI